MIVPVALLAQAAALLAAVAAVARLVLRAAPADAAASQKQRAPALVIEPSAPRPLHEGFDQRPGVCGSSAMLSPVPSSSGGEAASASDSALVRRAVRSPPPPPPPPTGAAARPKPCPLAASKSEPVRVTAAVRRARSLSDSERRRLSEVLEEKRLLLALGWSPEQTADEAPLSDEEIAEFYRRHGARLVEA